MTIHFEEEAESDLLAAINHLGDESPPLARAFYDDVFEAIHHLTRYPEIGRRYFDVPDERLRSVRVWVMRRFRYLIFYRAFEDRLLVERILHGSRDLIALFLDDE